jgi:hypothetical protein
MASSDMALTDSFSFNVSSRRSASDTALSSAGVMKLHEQGDIFMKERFDFFSKLGIVYYKRNTVSHFEFLE